MVMEFLEKGDLLDYLSNKVRCVTDHACVVHTYKPAYIHTYTHAYIH